MAGGMHTSFCAKTAEIDPAIARAIVHLIIVTSVVQNCYRMTQLAIHSLSGS
jgi:hypothetical protein